MTAPDVTTPDRTAPDGGRPTGATGSGPARRRFGRRTLLRAGLVAAPAAVLGGSGLTRAWAGAALDTAGRVAFVNRLAVPPPARSRRDEQGRRVVDLRLTPGLSSFRAGAATRIWGVDGGYLGPTLRATRGETVVVNLRNELAEPTSVHWHGMRLPARMDGGPHQTFAPGQVWSATWTVDQPAATLWYHPHPHGVTAQHVYRGLAGLFIVDDPAAPPDLPHRYGVDDVPVIVQDKRLDADNQLDESESLLGSTGILGDTILVNGTPGAYHRVVTDRVRLRLLNASNARVYRFGLSDGRPFLLVGTDGGRVDRPCRIDRVQLSPGERAEIVVTVRPGERVVLRSFPPDLGVGAWNARFSGGDDTLDILELRAADTLIPLPAPAEPPGAPTGSTPAATGPGKRRFTLSGVDINSRRMDPGRIDFAVTRDSEEVWELVNIDDIPHNFHVHDVRFRVLSIGDAPPPPALRGEKDTVYLPPGTPVRIAVRFGPHTDPNVPYMYHCHLLIHEDSGMMGQFVVVEPGTAADGNTEQAGGRHHHHG